MRKILLTMLLAGAATSPAFAQDQDASHRGHGDRPVQNAERQQSRQDDRQQAREERQQSRDQARAERPQFDAGRQQAEMTRQQQQQQADAGRRANFDRSRFNRGDDHVQGVDQTRDFDRGDRQARSNWQQRNSNWNGTADQYRQRQAWQQRSGNWNRENDQYRQRQGYQQQVDHRRQLSSRWSSGGWNRDWRNDRRYDWRNYREHHRSVFRLGIYYDPFDYNYRQFNIGYRLQPVYFGQNYWIDPAMYGLPFPPPGTAWVRYWNDALLVDTYTGEVVDAVRNFFW